MIVTWTSSKQIPNSLRPILIAIGDGKKSGNPLVNQEVVAGVYDPYIGFCQKDKWDRIENVVAWMYFPEHPNFTKMKETVKKNKGKKNGVEKST